MSRKDRTRATAGLAAAVALTAAAPAAADPTLRLDRPCYSPGDVMSIAGDGWAPVSTVDLSLTGSAVGFHTLTTDAAGLLRGEVDVTFEDADDFIPAGRPRATVTVAAIDRRAAGAGEGPAAGAATQVLISHFGAATNQDWNALRPRRPMLLDVVGFTGFAGRRLHIHYVRAGRRAASRPLGVLRGPCGDVRRTLPRALPFAAARPGRWTMVLNLSPRDHRPVPRVDLPVRVTR
jgi:hypothetical protein